MDYNYDESTRKHFVRSADVFPPEITRDNLIQLLIYLERTLENKDAVIEALKEDKAKLVLFEAKYARVCPADPIHALSRDSTFVPDLQPQASIGELFDDQMDALCRIRNGYNESHRRTLHIAQSAEDRLERAMNDLDTERKWKAQSVSLETIQYLKEENERLKNEIKRSNKYVDLLKKEKDEIELKRQAESERQKTIFLFLMNERKELLSTMSDIQLRRNDGITCEQKSLIEDLRNQIEWFNVERDSFKNVNNAMKGEIVALKEIARAQEEDLHLMKKNATIEDGSVVMTNRISMSASSRNLSSSSSFPSDKSRLPRAPGSSSSSNAPIASKTMIAKKTPAMGVRRRVERRGLAGEDTSRLTTTLVRSSSLCGQSEPRPLVTSILPKPSNGSNVSPISSPSPIQSSTLSRLPAKSDAKMTQTQITKTKSSLLRAFGK